MVIKKKVTDKLVKRTGGSEDMRGMFCIVKGRYDPKKGTASYDPCDEDTEEWYQLMDVNTFNTISCGSDINKMKRALVTTIKKHRTSEHYYRTLYENTTEDYYLTHYKGERPLSEKQVSDRIGQGMRNRVSRPMKEIYREVISKYGGHYRELLSECEDKAYSDSVFIPAHEKARQRGKGIKKLSTPVSKVPSSPAKEPPKKTSGTLKKGIRLHRK